MLAATLLILIGLTLPARAERPAADQFVQTDVFTHLLIAPAGPSGETSTVAVITTNKGIFVAYVPRGASSYAGFELKDLTPQNSSSIFIAFAGTSQVPERLYLPSITGAEQWFPIRGTFTVALDTGFARNAGRRAPADGDAPRAKVFVEVAMNNNSLPYTTVSTASAILGLSGTQVVSKGTGSSAVEVLSANKSSGPMNAEYEIDDQSRLLLGGRPLSQNSPVGLGTPPSHRCLFDGPSFATDEDIRAFASAALGTSLKGFVRKRHLSPITLSSFLPLTVSPNGIVALSYDSGKLMLIQEQHFPNSQGADSVWCVVSNLPVSNGGEVSSPAFKDAAEERR